MSAYLESQGCQVVAIQDPALLDATLTSTPVDLLLLDQRLGVTTGTDILLRIRGRTNLPCIVVTAQSDAVNRIVNLEIGADDEVEKSIPPREMLARIRSVLRRGRRMASAIPAGGAAEGADPGWRLSVPRRELRRPDGTLCHLTTAEFDTLRVLYDAAGTPVSRTVLYSRVFGRSFAPADRAVDTVVRKLRVKIGDAEAQRIIKTVRNVGYMFAGFSPDGAP